jgi:hypothetical protein
MIPITSIYAKIKRVADQERKKLVELVEQKKIIKYTNLSILYYVDIEENFNYNMKGLTITNSADFKLITSLTQVIIIVNNIPIPDLKDYNIKLVILKSSFNGDLYNLPDTVRHIALDRSSVFNKFNQLPQRLESLHIDNNYNGSFKDLPRYLRHLKVNSNFNDEFTIFSSYPYLEYIDLSCSNFNKPIYNISKNLIKLKLPTHFNSNIDLSDSNLLSIELGSWNGDINKLPKSLIELDTLGFNQPFDGRLFPRLRWARFTALNDQFIFPPNLEIIIFGNYFDQNITISSKLKMLIFMDESTFNKPLKLEGTNLTHLHLGLKYRQVLDKLPLTIKQVYLPMYYISYIDDISNIIFYMTDYELQQYYYHCDISHIYITNKDYNNID